MNEPVLKVKYIDPEQASFSFGTPDNPVKETILFVDIEFRGVPYEIELTKRYEQGHVWQMNNVYYNGDYYEIHQMFSEQEIQFIYHNIMKTNLTKLKQVEEQEPFIFIRREYSHFNEVKRSKWEMNRLNYIY